jgi:hypothetical protein
MSPNPSSQQGNAHQKLLIACRLSARPKQEKRIPKRLNVRAVRLEELLCFLSHLRNRLPKQLLFVFGSQFRHLPHVFLSSRA